MFGRKERSQDLEREVKLEVEILKKLHGDDAPRVAREKASRPTNRTFRQKVLDGAARQLESGGGSQQAPKSVLERLLGR